VTETETEPSTHLSTTMGSEFTSIHPTQNIITSLRNTNLVKWVRNTNLVKWLLSSKQNTTWTNRCFVTVRRKDT